MRSGNWKTIALAALAGMAGMAMAAEKTLNIRALKVTQGTNDNRQLVTTGVEFTLETNFTSSELSSGFYVWYRTQKPTGASDDEWTKLVLAEGKSLTVAAVAGAANRFTVAVPMDELPFAAGGSELYWKVSVTLGGVQLWENGPYWSETNVGASTATEYGYYFWWGDTVGYVRNGADNGWVSHADSSVSFLFSKENSAIATFNVCAEDMMGTYIDSTYNLVPKHDAATAHRGLPWRMPTEAEFDELIAKCDIAWEVNVNGSGVNGVRVIGKGSYSTKSIFFPAAGIGNSSKLALAGERGYCYLATHTNGKIVKTAYLNANSVLKKSETSDLWYGRPVRPVR